MQNYRRCGSLTGSNGGDQSGRCGCETNDRRRDEQHCHGKVEVSIDVGRSGDARLPESSVDHAEILAGVATISLPKLAR
jgi:hypothetical protein